jgi:hypothetical protein
MSRPTAILPFLAGLCVIVATSAAPAGADTMYAPTDRPGPALSVPAAVLRKNVSCTATATHARRNVVLFVPATTQTPQQYSWNWFPALDKLSIPYCAVTEPNNAMSDLQISAEYVVYAIRYVHAISGRKVDVLGHSQGGLEPRFALRFWPDLRPMVDHYVAFGTPNHGSVLVDALCPPDAGCAPALWQQTYESSFIQALNSYQETFPGIAYTDIYTHNDEFVQPNLTNDGVTSLHGGGGAITNVALQDVCPLDASEHLAIGTYDPVAYAIALDAITHAGPADPARISRSVCSQVLMPGVAPLQFPADYADDTSLVASELALYPRVAAEPPLMPFVFAR